MDNPSRPAQDRALLDDAHASQDHLSPPPPPASSPQDGQLPPTPASTEDDHQDPLDLGTNPRTPPNAFFLTRTWLLALLPPFLLYFPLASLPLGAVVGVYHYLLHEERLNPALVRATPPSKDEELPKGRREWLKSGGLLQVEKGEWGGEADGDGGDEAGECVVCRGEWEDPVRVRDCGHVFCGGCLGSWFGAGHRT